MLARGSEYGMDDGEATDRIKAWTDGAEGEYADFATAGAREGVAFATEAAHFPHLFDKLNDPAWLFSRFTAGHAEQAVAG